MTTRLRWGIIGTGLIAHELADGVKASTTGILHAVGSRTRASAEKFGDEFGIPKRYDSYDALLADPDVQAVYISTPHPMHAEWAVKCAEAGKHILVEKPIGMNAAETMAIIEAAREHDVFLMEAFMYRCHPQTDAIAKLVRERAIGDVQLIRAAFSYRAGFNPEIRQYAQALGGGGILDVGCYPVSMSRRIVGAVSGKSFENPIEVKGAGHLGASGIDEYAVATLKFATGDIVAQCSTGIGMNQQDDNIVEIFGTDGKLTIRNPWIPSRYNRDPLKVILKRHGEKEPREILLEAPLDLYTYEADTVANHIAQRQAPAMSWADSLGNIRTLDRWRAELGFVYDLEKPANASRTISGWPLRVRALHNMKYGRIAGIEKSVARLVMGCASNHTMPETNVLLDDYFERGGNAFDTSHGYGNPNGACERNLGWWIKHRGVRDQVVVIEKGANNPNDHPAGLTKELISGLERLQLDYVDLYLIHRDNELVPIGEWVDVLNENRRAGRMKAFGVSNFSVARLKAFDAYAKQHGLESFRVVSNQFSLARMLAPPWNMHLVSSSDDDARRWFESTQTPLVAWSSQARGFFTDRSSPENRSDAELVRCWYSDENFRRKARAAELAKKRGVEAIHIALAYVLAQPFPTFPIIGPLQPSETRDSLRALDVTLSPDELKWLNPDDSR